MAGLMRREPRGGAADVFGRFDRLFEEWLRMMPFRAAGRCRAGMLLPGTAGRHRGDAVGRRPLAPR